VRCGGVEDDVTYLLEGWRSVGRVVDLPVFSFHVEVLLVLLVMRVN